MGDVNWGLIRPSGNSGETFLKAFQAGQADRREKEARSALELYSTDPEGAVSALMKYDPQTALALEKRNREKAAIKRREEIGATYAKDPKAARAAAMAAGDFDLAQAFGNMDEDNRKMVVEQGRTTYQVVRTLGKLPYEQRKTAIQRMAPALSAQTGIPVETLMQVDPTDQWVADKMIEGAQFEEKAQLVQSGRYVRGYNPQTGDKRYEDELPVDPLEQEDRRSAIEARRASTAAQQEQAKLQRERFEYERDNPDPQKTLARIQQKIARGETLTPGEQQLYDDSRQAKTDPLMAGLYGDPDLPVGSGKGGGKAGTQANPAKPATAADFAKLPSGTWFVNPADGRVLKKK